MKSLDIQVSRYYDDYYMLKENSWSGALDTLKDIEENDKIEDFCELINEYFGDDIIDETELNDYIWFERDSIYEELGIDIDE